VARLLFDENLSESVAARIAPLVPDSEHVRRVLGVGVDDEHVWAYARSCGLTLVTLDEDFERLSVARGIPPKVVLLATHNARNAQLVALLVAKAPVIERFVADPESAVLILCTAD